MGRAYVCVWDEWGRLGVGGWDVWVACVWAGRGGAWGGGWGSVRGKCWGGTDVRWSLGSVRKRDSPMVAA